MRHAFLLVQLYPGQGPAVVVDPNFRDRFVYSMLPPNTTYGACVAALPKLFVGTLATIASLVNLVSSALQKEAAARGHDLPPWRSPRALMTNWLPARFTDSVHAPPACGLHPVLLNTTHGHSQQPTATAPTSACGSSAAACSATAQAGGRQLGPSTVVRGFIAAPAPVSSAAAPMAIPAGNGRPLVLNLLTTTTSCNTTTSACCSANSSLCSSPASSCGLASPNRSHISTAAASSSQTVMAGDGADTSADASCAADGDHCRRADAAGAAGARALAIALAMGCAEEERCCLAKSTLNHSHQQHQQPDSQPLRPPLRKRVSLLTRSLSAAAASAAQKAAARVSFAAAPLAPRSISIRAAAAAVTGVRGGEVQPAGDRVVCIKHVEEEEAQQRGSNQAIAALRQDAVATPSGRCSSAARQAAPHAAVPVKAATGKGGCAAAAAAACEVVAASSLPMRHCVSSANLTALKQLPVRSGVWEDAPARPLPCRRHPALQPAAEANMPLPAPPMAAPAAPAQQTAQPSGGVVPGTRRCFAPRVSAETVPILDTTAAVAPIVRCC
ncbi:hypothetical protein CHLRE_09g403150v5 [Chlamydomonas reinhardtii]|uniref:Uncharacterized protein n=1 Tax=Chlamydomonas reinhardtii TaxID=3055 RepID=A0A2K3DCN1_CHLRE|nr:uncharacterized protein CHLRE_09g403150v5 [Chlamydomonas reinhardtii]PNW78296.1 hypothetical protein CHLRE_09g403150v5 [Chlamydomonas reinhardtii]